MENNKIILGIKPILLALVIIFISNNIFAQTDSLQVQNTEPKQKKKDRKRRDEFKVFAGLSVNEISIASDKYESVVAPGFILGATYKRGRFFYWELGARYNNPVYNLHDLSNSSDPNNILDGAFSVRSVDVPITFGINVLSITSRIVGLRVFVSAVPTFALGVGSNDINITKDNINSFMMYGQGGIGVDAAFLFLEAGLNYGFTDLFKNDIQSKPYQIFLNLGFRF
ncbi:MAG: hypothetical protein CL661_09760 [Bacteroidetes bacterium]|nr:hypothetical protein [Bacteroidota bacterium]|tara:strand:- start:806 stop:1483 length:678 start_codon:yes stop_codon:yes gene_type:complete